MKITLTGADERTHIQDLVDLVAKWPAVEIGLLYSHNIDGGNRYPSRPWLLTTAQALSGRCALHVCGRMARDELLAGDMADIVAHTPRVQVNGRMTVDETVAAAARVRLLITQHNNLNPGLLDAPCENHQILVDSSGGRGMSPDAWKTPHTKKQVGYAGGMGPDNLGRTLLSLSMIFKGEWWVDMESKLRRDDWFDIALARRAAEIFDLAMGATHWAEKARHDRMVLRCNNAEERQRSVLRTLTEVHACASPEQAAELSRMAKANSNDVNLGVTIDMKPEVWARIVSLLQDSKE